MPLMYEPCPDAIYPVGESLTEQEHAAECDINRIMARAKAGLPITSSASAPVYGDDDLNQDLMSVKLKKQDLEKSLSEMAQETLSESEVARLPNWLKEKFGFKAKTPSKGEKNDLNNKTPPDTVTATPKVDGPSGAVKPDGAPS